MSDLSVELLTKFRVNTPVQFNRRYLLLALAMVLQFLTPLPSIAHKAEPSDRICYYTVSNTTDFVMRRIDLLVDENDFTEQKLRLLMDQLREKYSEPNLLVMFYSKLDQYQESQMGHADVMLAGQPRRRHARGILICRGDDRVIRYAMEDEIELRTIVVNGIDPF